MWHAPSKTYLVQPGTRIRIYDNFGKTIDRYTVVLSGKDWKQSNGLRSCLAMDIYGINISQFSQCKMGKHLGKLVQFSDLHIDTQKHILSRLHD